MSKFDSGSRITCKKWEEVLFVSFNLMVFIAR